MTCSKFTQNALNLCWQKFGGKLLSLPAFQSEINFFLAVTPWLFNTKEPIININSVSRGKQLKRR